MYPSADPNTWRYLPARKQIVIYIKIISFKIGKKRIFIKGIGMDGLMSV
jgi:hypothetical protein